MWSGAAHKGRLSIVILEATLLLFNWSVFAFVMSPHLVEERPVLDGGYQLQVRGEVFPRVFLEYKTITQLLRLNRELANL